jgi:hypothetical protein
LSIFGDSGSLKPNHREPVEGWHTQKPLFIDEQTGYLLATIWAMTWHSPNVILVAKSKTQTVQGKNALANSVCQAMASRQNDFASSIKTGQEPNGIKLT